MKWLGCRGLFRSGSLGCERAGMWVIGGVKCFAGDGGDGGDGGSDCGDDGPEDGSYRKCP